MTFKVLSKLLKDHLRKSIVEGVRVKIIHSGAGAITESDIILASASNAIVIGFNVRPEPQALATAEQEKVDIRLHSIIYNVIEEIEQAMKGMLDPIFKEVIIGQAEVRNIFKITKVGTIAGCMVTSGKITRSAKARLIRSGIVVFDRQRLIHLNALKMMQKKLLKVMSVVLHSKDSMTLKKAMLLKLHYGDSREVINYGENSRRTRW